MSLQILPWTILAVVLLLVLFRTAIMMTKLQRIVTPTRELELDAIVLLHQVI